MKKTAGFTLLVTLCCSYVLRCSDPQNPYLDVNESRAVFSSLSINNDDTVSIFGKDSIGIKIFLREHLSHFTIAAPGNRYWTDTTIGSSGFERNALVFPLSVYDTGWHNLSLVTHRNNGDSIAQQYQFYAVSPLNQATLDIIAGDSVMLSTHPVSEGLYVWDLHSLTILSSKPKMQYFFREMPASQVGEIYVIDDNGHRSPSSFFVIRQTFTADTEIRVIIESPPVVNDTIVSGTPVVQIIGTVTGGALVSKILINETMGESEPSKTEELNGKNSFLYEVNGLDTRSPMIVTVKIIDTLDAVTIDTFYLVYKPTGSTTQPAITMKNPSSDSSLSDNDVVFLYGMVTNSGYYPSGAITYTKNGNVVDGRYTLSDGYFGIPVILDEGRNSFMLKFIGDTLAGTVLTSKTILMYYNQMVRDSTGPAITAMYNGKELNDSTVFRSSEPVIDLLLLDNNAINGVTVNGSAAVASADSINNLPTYKATLSLGHPDNTLTIAATDAYNNKSNVTYQRIRFNRLPVIVGDFTNNEGLAGTTFTWNVSATDQDMDQLTVTAIINGTIIPLSAGGIIQWTSTIGDTGLHSVMIQAYDGYEKVDVSFDIYISQKPETGIAVKWETDPADIPGSLVAGEDTLRIPLQAKSISNLRPFTYRIEITDLNKVIHNGSDSNFVWAPDSSLVGVHTFQFTITDRDHHTDTFTDAVVIKKSDPAFVEFASETFNGYESSSVATLTVELTKALTTSVIVSYAIDSSSTTALGADYTLTSGNPLIFQPGETSKSIAVTIFDDMVPEPNRTIAVKITGVSSNAHLGSRNTATFIVYDDDYSEYSFTTSVQIESRKPFVTDTVPIVVKLTRPLSEAVTLNCSVADEYTTATTADYSLPQSSQTFTIPAGDTVATIRLLIRPGTGHGMFPGMLPEDKKIVALRLGSADAVLHEGNITLFKYIIGEETAFYIDNNTLSVMEDDSISIISIRRKDTIVNSVSFYFEVNKQLTTAVDGVDYQLKTVSPITFDPWYLRSKQVKVLVFDNDAHDGNKKVVIDFTDVSSGGYLATDTRVEVLIIDDETVQHHRPP